MDRSNLLIGAGVLVGLGTVAYYFMQGGVMGAGSGAGKTGTSSGKTPAQARNEYIQRTAKYTASLYE